VIVEVDGDDDRIEAVGWLADGASGWTGSMSDPRGLRRSALRPERSRP
jgi:hypothetical protein